MSDPAVPDILVVESSSPAETTALGRRLGELIEPGTAILLHGDLGAGKTTFTQGLAAGLGIDGPAQSPTFTLVNEYPPAATGARLHHLDLYRLDGPDDLGDIGYDDLLAVPDGIVVIEWPERAGNDLPDDALVVEIDHAGPDRRSLRFRGLHAGDRHWSLVAALRAALAIPPAADIESGRRP